MPLIPRQPEVDKEVIAYWLEKLYWNAEEFAALYCGVNPFALKDDDDWETRYMFGSVYDRDESYELKVSKQKKEDIEEFKILIKDRLEVVDRIGASPSVWRSRLDVLKLSPPSWMNNLPSPKNVMQTDLSVSKNKSLGARERDSLLVIIAALCKASGIDYRDRGTSIKIKELIQLQGSTIDEGTVKKWIDLIPDALDKRSK